METDPIEEAAHPSGTHPSPGAADKPAPGDRKSGEEEIIDGRNPTQRKIDAEHKIDAEQQHSSGTD